MLNKIAQLERNSQNNPTKGFEFTLENRLQCGDCNRVQYSAVSSSTIILQIPAIKDGFDESGKVKYQDVNLEDLVSGYFAPDTRTFTCPQDKKQCPAIQ